MNIDLKIKKKLVYIKFKILKIIEIKLNKIKIFHEYKKLQLILLNYSTQKIIIHIIYIHIWSIFAVVTYCFINFAMKMRHISTMIFPPQIVPISYLLISKQSHVKKRLTAMIIIGLQYKENITACSISIILLFLERKIKYVYIYIL